MAVKYMLELTTERCLDGDEAHFAITTFIPDLVYEGKDIVFATQNQINCLFAPNEDNTIYTRKIEVDESYQFINACSEFVPSPEIRIVLKDAPTHSYEDRLEMLAKNLDVPITPIFKRDVTQLINEMRARGSQNAATPTNATTPNATNPTTPTSSNVATPTVANSNVPF